MDEAPITRETFDEVFTPNYAPADQLLERGLGSRVWDESGKEYIDFAAGIAVNILGHASPIMVDALTDQAGRIWHHSNAYASTPGIRLARTLVRETFADKVFLCNSGGEANEAALKLARRYAYDNHGEGKHEIVSFQKSFHGRTLFTVSVGGQPKYTEGFGPVPEGIHHLPYNDLDALGEVINERTCAVMVEPVMGEGGLIEGEPVFLQRLRDRCDATGALLIFDEVQSGMGRTGDLFAYMGYGITPDILTSAKGLGGGFPIGVMLATAEVGASMVIGTHGSTFGGNPLAASVANAVLGEILSGGFLDEVNRKANQLRAGLEQIGQSRGVYQEVRGRGLWLGAVLDGSWAGRSKDVADAAFEHGAMVLRAGSNVVRFAPALNITEEELTEGLKRFDAALRSLVA
jgi:succinylornithine transaminase family protein